jgi:uncharacterized membrane protein (DUF4010 family)
MNQLLYCYLEFSMDTIVAILWVFGVGCMAVSGPLKRL